MDDRRTFIKKSGLIASAFSLQGVAAFPLNLHTFGQPKVSLAQWSLHRALESRQTKAEDFASVARNDYGIEAVEYVNSFYKEEGSNELFWKQMQERADNEGVKSLLIMVDNEGELGNPGKESRKQAVENHFKWIHACKLLGGHSIRVNAFGSGDRDSLKDALADGLGQLAEYGGKEGINILIENHGLHTSDAEFMVEIIKTVNHPYLGTLPDFGNWCLNTEWGSTQNRECSQVYDPLKGVAQFLPYAKGVSAKSYAFNEQGFESLIDYRGLLGLVKNSEYQGYIGIEYEGIGLSEAAGIKATKTLIERVWRDLEN
jgi:sugar phosphate isomerase/epimerase